MSYTHDELIDPVVDKLNASGRMRATINIGPVAPPPCKGRIPPQYDRKNLSLLQSKADELESPGILARPEDVGIEALYVSPSFLVPKSDGDLAPCDFVCWSC